MSRLEPKRRAWVDGSNLRRLGKPMNNHSTFSSEHPVLGTILIAYIVISGLMMFGDVRRLLMRWYRSQVWLVSGNGVLDILFKQIGYRLTVELFAFIVACIVGSIGGNIWIIMRARSVKM